MNPLKFSDLFNKFPDGLYPSGEVLLMEVFKTRFEDLHSGFVEYDTTTRNYARHELPKYGDALVLLLMHNTEMFTTIRKYSPVKEYEFKAMRGQFLTVEIGKKHVADD